MCIPALLWQAVDEVTYQRMVKEKNFWTGAFLEFPNSYFHWELEFPEACLSRGVSPALPVTHLMIHSRRMVTSRKNPLPSAGTCLDTS
jgi:hypothetical protein